MVLQHIQIIRVMTDKKQVQYMVKKLLSLSCVPKPDDAADALAIAICHSHSLKIKSLS